MEGDSTIYRIVDRVYLSTVVGASSAECLEAIGISHILTVGSSLPTPFKKRFTYMKIDILDSVYTDLLAVLPGCIDFIANSLSCNQNNAVLVHCYAGISRSVSVLCAYLMKEFGMSFTDSFEHIKLVRPKIQPNQGFMFQLKEYERIVKECTMNIHSPFEKLVNKRTC